MIEEIRLCVLCSWVCKNAGISISTILFLGNDHELQAPYRLVEAERDRDGSERERPTVRGGRN
jgi:hypothetical protein